MKSKEKNMENKVKKQKLGFSIGIFDILTSGIRKKIRKEAEECEVYGIGVYTDDFIEKELNTQCLKNQEQRMMIARELEGVDFIFSIDSKEAKKAKEELEKAYFEYTEQRKIEEEQKKYKLGFTIGSFDVLHSGHIENIKLAKKLCDKLAVVVKTDERIKQNKHKDPLQNTLQRAENVGALKYVDHVFYMDLNTTREELIEEIQEYYGVEKSDMVLVLGSDLKRKEEEHKEELKDINVVFTDRNEEKMKEVSSSGYQKKLRDMNTTIKDLEDLEEEQSC